MSPTPRATLVDPPTDAERLWLTVPNRLAVICGRGRDGEKGSMWRRGPLVTQSALPRPRRSSETIATRNVKIDYAVLADK